MPLSAELVEETQQFWERRAGEAITPEGARQAASNVTRLFDLLGRWAQEADGAASPAAEEEARSEAEKGLATNHEAFTVTEPGSGQA